MTNDQSPMKNFVAGKASAAISAMSTNELPYNPCFDGEPGW
jgi:hypothetical protein